MTHTIPETAERLAAEKNEIDDTIDRLARAAHHAIDRVAAHAETLGELQEAWVESAGNQVRARPLTSLALAVAAGVLIDRLLR